MKTQGPTSLARNLAVILTDIRSEADRRAAERGLVAALHALILSAFARLFTRLETLVSLWQAGQLPLPLAPPRIPIARLHPPGQTRQQPNTPRPHRGTTPGFRPHAPLQARLSPRAKPPIPRAPLQSTRPKPPTVTRPTVTRPTVKIFFNDPRAPNPSTPVLLRYQNN